MVSNAFIDIAIGLALMYLLLSIFCTIINEFIATFLKFRANSLRSGIEQLLDEPTIRAQFYDHGLINGANGNSAGGPAAADDHFSYISGQTFAMALLGSLDPTKPVPAFGDLESAIKSLPNSNVRDAMLSQVLTADTSITKLRDGLANWFDQSMDRLSGDYKRKIKLVTCAVGFVLALGINADTIKVANTLWHDADLRASIVQVADHTVAAGMSKSSDSKETTSLTNPMAEALLTEKSLRPFPVGWDFSKLNSTSLAWKCVLLKLLGLLLTTAALTLGAPFWFDLLSKFMRIRGTGERPERTSAP